MPRRAPELAVVLGRRPPGVTLADWLYGELRSAILDGRLARGARLPATRDLSARYGISRGVVIGAFEQLREEGYVTSRVGSGTVVRARVPEDYLTDAGGQVRPPARPREGPAVRPFCPIEPALSEFPMKTWARLYARVFARASPRLLARSAPAGERPLREAVAAYLGASRGVACSPEHVIIVAGAQQGLDLIARSVVRPGAPVWMEDPGYSGAVDAFRNAGAKLVPVRVDDEGLDPVQGRRLCARPAAVYLTPAHQFCLGAALSPARRADLLRLSRETGALLVEDDYDSEFRYSGPPLPALKSLAGAESVFLVGTFSKVLFPSLRLGYVVAPDAWVERLLALRYQADLYPPSIAQTVLAAFIAEGHFARHLRRMRERYGARCAALQESVDRYLGGALRLPEIQAGLSTPAYLPRNTPTRLIVEQGRRQGLDLWPLDRYALKRRDLRGLLLGYAAFTERQIREAVVVLGRTLQKTPLRPRRAVRVLRPHCNGGVRFVLLRQRPAPAPLAIGQAAQLPTLMKHSNESPSSPQRGTAPFTPIEARTPREPIAIVGVGCRFPGGAHSADQFWELLAGGVDAIGDVPADRWDVRSFYDPDPKAPGKTCVKLGGYVRQSIEEFDAHFFGISPREAAWLDPQQRLLLEVTWEAFEDAGIAPERLAGSDVGVFTGGFMVDAAGVQMGYLNRHQIGQHSAVGASLTMLSARLSYVFDLRGPSISIDTACSSSLVAAHYACSSLWNGECSAALVAGVNVMFNPAVPISLTKGGFLAPDGRCKAFDASANGYARAEGAGVVLLKPLSAARRDRDRIYAVILGTAVNQDGRSEGITQPSQAAQETLLRDAYRRAGVAPSHAQYVEAHGTGTPVGDPIEAAALASVLGAGRSAGRPCLVGSVKTNVGHMEGAAGVGGLIKATLALRHRQVPPHLHLKEPSPVIPFDQYNLRIPRSLEPWPACDGAAIASVNSFGYGGTNAHVVLREAPADVAANATSTGEATNGDERLVPFSARSPQALRAYAQSLADALQRRDDVSLDDIVYSAGERRSHHEHRAALVVRSRSELVERLRSFGAGEATAGLIAGRTPRTRPALVFVYTGMGPQWWGMGRELFRTEPAFRAAAEACDAALTAQGAPFSVLATLLAGDPQAAMNDTFIAQTTNFLIQAALTGLWRSWGVTPDCIVGHSAGEVGAAFASSALSPDEAARVALCRATQHARRAGAGRMLAIELSPDQAEELIAPFRDEVCIAAINAPRSVALSGTTQALEAIATLLEARQVFNRFVHGGVPYHSHLMNPIEHDLVAGLAGVRSRAPAVPLYSTVTGNRVAEGDLDAAYWWRNTRQPVLFDAALASILEAHDGNLLFVEIGPHPVLSAAISAGLSARGRTGATTPSLYRKRPERETALAALGRLHVEGHPIEFSRQHGPGARFTPLPAYPWQRERHWFESAEARLDRLGPDGHPLLGRRVAAANPTWEAELNVHFLPYLPDHAVQGEVVLPGAAYVEAALAIHRELFEDEACALEDLEFHGALIIALSKGTRLRLAYDPATGRFTIHSHQPGDERSWALHASGRILSQTPSPRRTTLDLDELRARCDRSVLPSAIYPALRRRGLAYGPWFRGIRGMAHDGAGEALARVDLGRPLEGQQALHLLHPALLDSCFQSLMMSMALAEGRVDHNTYLPVGVDEIRLAAAPHGAVWAYGRLVARNDLEVRSELWLCDDQGKVLAELRGIRAQAVARATPKAANEYDDWFYEVRWEARALPKLGARPEAANSAPWLVFASRPSTAEPLVAALEKAGRRVVRIGDDIHREVADVAQQGGVAGAIYVAADTSLEADPAAETLPGVDLSRESTGISSCVRLMHVIQALAEIAPASPPPRLVVATTGAHRVHDDEALAGFAQAPLWGVARVSNIEIAQLRCACVDLDPADPLGPAQLDGLLAELFGGSEETEIALRAGVRFVSRLDRVKPSSALRKQWVAAPSTPVALTSPEQRGNLGTLGFERATRQKPGPDEVEINVHTAGVTFKDVLKLRGILNARDLDGGFTGSRIGMECGGVITAVGQRVTGFSVGDEVVGFAPGCFASYAIARAADVCHKPRGMSLEEVAAAGPYLTAYYALAHLARLRRGERVLIHSAATGVGLAALNWARHIGAEVFATAGSDEKRAYLASLGVRLVSDSRSLAFADEVLEATGGRGVDVVLNSQTGEALNKSLEVLAPRGRFVDLRYWGGGARLELSPGRFPKNVSLLGVDLDSMFEREKEYTGALMREVVGLLESGALTPLPTTVFSAARAAAAFEHIGKPEHIGRVLVTMHDQHVPVPREGAPSFRGDASYLITGGLGGFGLKVADWLVEQGARHLVLVGRSGASSDSAQAAVAALEARGASVTVIKADVAAETAVARALAEAQRDRPLRGVFHAAAVFDGKFLLHSSDELLLSSMEAKVLGAWHLHRMTLDLPLDHFVLFSSVAGTLGETGTAGYSAGNSFLDALAQYRRARGLPALSMGWGLIGDVGIGVRDPRLGAIVQASGHKPVEVDALLDVLAEALVTQPGHLSVTDMDWVRWAQMHPLANTLPRLSLVIPEGAATAGPAGGTFREALLAVEPPSRARLVTARLGEQLARVLGLSADKIDPDRPLPEFGLDSLMASELAIRLEKDTGVAIQVMSLLRRGTLRDLAERMLDEVTSAPAPAAAEPALASP